MGPRAAADVRAAGAGPHRADVRGRPGLRSPSGLSLEQKIGLGFWRSSPVTGWGGEGAFGHGGAGGSYGFADPERGLAVGYVMNKMAEGVLLDPRAPAIVEAVYAAVGADAKYI